MPLEAKARAFVEKISREHDLFYNSPLGYGALRDLDHIFFHPSIYLAELVQNAIDAGATKLRLEVCSGDRLVFEHNGAPFRKPHVKGLCSKGVSTKGAGAVGFMGIGFKAVFRSFERVSVSSGHWKFSLEVPVVVGQTYGERTRDWLGCVLPRWDEGASPPSVGMRCRFELGGRLAGTEPISEDLTRTFGARNELLPLLAWRGVCELTWHNERWLLSRTVMGTGTGVDDERIKLEALSETKECLSRWLLFSTPFTPSPEAVRRFLEHRQIRSLGSEDYSEAAKTREVAAFCELDSRGAPVVVERGDLYALLPVGRSLGIGLHLHADWLLSASRHELMALKGNPWHQEILLRVPHLLAQFLAWSTGDEGPAEGWDKAYPACPGSFQQENELDAWLADSSAQPLFLRELEAVSCLPVVGNETIEFVRCQDGRALPSHFLADFDTEATPAEPSLFGDHVVSQALLGHRATAFFQRLGALREFQPSEIETLWADSGIERWWLEQEPLVRQTRLLALWGALGQLDLRPDWRDQPLRCIRTESDGWAPRSAVCRFPPDWDLTASQQDVAEMLSRYLGPTEKLVSWPVDRAARQTQSTAMTYLARCRSRTLDEILGDFWREQSDQFDENARSKVVSITAWIRKTLPQRPNLVLFALGTDGSGQECLSEPSKLVLADPYAGAHRRVIFGGLPVISDEYLRFDGGVEAASWRAFWESMPSQPQGRFSLMISRHKLSASEAAALAPDGVAPGLKARSRTDNWRGLPIESAWHWRVDAVLPPHVVELLAREPDHAMGQALVDWLGEGLTQFQEYSRQFVVYIPKVGSHASHFRTRVVSTWPRALTGASWLFATDGTGPFCPGDLLPARDAARPEAGVAAIEPQLATALVQSGVEFGNNVPKPAAFARLGAEAATAPAARIVELLQDAVREAGDDPAKILELRDVVSGLPFFPVPSGLSPVDGASRVSARRLVTSLGKSSSYGYWLIPLDAYPPGASEHALAESIVEIATIAERPTPQQVLDFVLWVWSREPDAEQVRTILPLAYSSVRSDPPARVVWQSQRLALQAKVFVPGRRWVPVSGTANLYLNDLDHAGIAESLPGVALATAGHLGETMDEQVANANLLELPLLSDTYRVVSEHDDEMELPVVWRKRFSEALDSLRLAAFPAGGLSPDVAALEIERHGSLELKVYKGAEPLFSQPRLATIEGPLVRVSGLPADFAADLCRVIFDAWGMRLRRDLLDLLPQFVILFSKLDSETLHPNEDEPEEPPEPEEAKPGEKIPPGTKSRRPGGGYTAESREDRLRSLEQKKVEIERKIRELRTTGVGPTEPEPTKRPGSFGSDDIFRDAVLKYEQDHGRWPEAKAAGQGGHDIDSYTSPSPPVRRLTRRIEVKGRTTHWRAGEIVEMSDRQFMDAFGRVVQEGEPVAEDFDYWLYVVVLVPGEDAVVAPVRNPARMTQKYELRGDSWLSAIEPADLAGIEPERRSTTS